MEMPLTLPVGQGPANAPSLLWKVTHWAPPPSWIPSSLELKIMEAWRKEVREEAAEGIGNALVHTEA